MASNEYTKMQIRKWVEEAIRKAKDPDERIIIKKKREKRKKVVAKYYGF